MRLESSVPGYLCTRRSVDGARGVSASRAFRVIPYVFLILSDNRFDRIFNMMSCNVITRFVQCIADVTQRKNCPIHFRISTDHI